MFDCAMANRKFYLPKEGEMPLQFFHVEDLCRFIDVLLEKKPEEKIYNVGNAECVSIKEWVQLCYEVVGSKCETVPVFEEINQREYFSFYDYAYKLDVTRQKALMSETKSLKEGLKESYTWYRDNKDKVNRKEYIKFIDEKL